MFVTGNHSIVEQLEKRSIKLLRETKSDTILYGKKLSELQDWELVLLKTDMTFAVLTSIAEEEPTMELGKRIRILYMKRYEHLFEHLGKPIFDNVIENEEEEGNYSIKKNIDTIDLLYDELRKMITTRMDVMNLHKYPLSLN